MLSYKIEVRNFLNMCLNFKSEHIIKGAIVQIEKKQGKLPCGFSKNVSSKERVKSSLFVTFNVIISYIFPENFIKIPQVVQKI